MARVMQKESILYPSQTKYVNNQPGIIHRSAFPVTASKCPVAGGLHVTQIGKLLLYQQVHTDMYSTITCASTQKEGPLRSMALTPRYVCIGLQLRVLHRRHIHQHLYEELLAEEQDRATR